MLSANGIAFRQTKCAQFCGTSSDYILRVAKREQMSASESQAAIQEEQNRLYRFLHDRVSPHLMAIAFLAESLAKKLETTQPEAAKEAEEIRRLLGDVFDELHLFFVPPLAKSSDSPAPTAPGPVGAEP
jgi:signal transduction histidine kinase